MEALGRLFDVGIGWAPVDLDTADGATGIRTSMSSHDAVTFLVFAAAGGSTALTLDVQQHTAYTGGTSNDLDSAAVASSTGVTAYYIKAETSLDNDEAWTRVTQAEASEVVLAAGTGAQQYIIAIEIRGSQLGTGYTHVSLNASGTLAAPKLAACLVLPHELRYQRKPTGLRNLLRPSAANV